MCVHGEEWECGEHGAAIVLTLNLEPDVYGMIHCLRQGPGDWGVTSS